MRVGRLLWCIPLGAPLLLAMLAGGCGTGREMTGATPKGEAPAVEAPATVPEPEADTAVPEPVPAPAPEAALPKAAPPEGVPAEGAPGAAPSLPPAQPFDIFGDIPAPAPPPQRAEPETYEVYVPDKNYAFVPRQLTIYVGDTVVWKNNSGVVHLFATIPGSDPTGRMEIEPEDLLVGAEVAHTFDRPGEYPYFCFIHNRMTGRIVVLERQ